jgi:FG-GAP repeat
MRRVLVVLLFALAATVWPAASGLTRTSATTRTAAAAGNLQADFNHDGFADLAIGAPFEDLGGLADAGAVNVVYGTSTGLAGTGSQVFTQDSPGVAGRAEVEDLFGLALATGDFNHDGFADLAVGVPQEALGAIRGAGAVNVLYGGSAGLTGVGSQLFTQDSPGIGTTAESFEFFGEELASGDFNDDGVDDLVVGVPFESVGGAFDAGAVNVLYGTSTGLTGTGSQLFTQNSPGVAGAAEQSDLFGFALAAGDFNHDGIDDLAVGAPGESVNGVFSAGAVNVLPGSAAKLTGTGSQQFTQDSPGVGSTAEDEDSFGDVLAAGDFNHDGFADLAVGVPFEDVATITLAGAVNVLYGSAGLLTGTGSQLFTQDSPGIGGTAEQDDHFGFTLAAGDFNNDGFADLAVGAPFEAVGRVQVAGAVNVLPGSAAKLTGTGSQVFTQDSPGIGGTAEENDIFGGSLAASDFDHDGFADLAVGVPGESVGTDQGAGAVNVLYGSASLLTGTGSQVFTQDSPGIGGTAEQGDDFAGALAASGPQTAITSSASPTSSSRSERRREPDHASTKP